MSSVAAVKTTETATTKSDENGGFWKSVHDFFLPHVEVRKVIMEKETAYVNLRVEEDSQKNRHLVFLPKKGSQGIWNPSQPDKLISNYLKVSLAVLGATPEPPEKVLFIGLGPGIFPRFLHRNFPAMTIDIVEIDKDVVAVAKKWFDFKEDEKIKTIIADGRAFINKCQEKYDLIYVDAYNAKAIPFHLTTIEFYTQLKSCLTPNGILAVNIANLGKIEFIASELLTIKKVFRNVAVYVTPGATNYVPLASSSNKFRQQTIIRRLEQLDAKHSFGVPFKEHLARRMTAEELNEFTSDQAIVLRDDFAPVNEMK